MKKLLILIIPAMFGCDIDTPKREGSPLVKINNGGMSFEREILLYIIDSCEYIGGVYNSHGDFLTHKGNCKFCRERNYKKH